MQRPLENKTAFSDIWKTKTKPANQNNRQLLDKILRICLCALKMRTQERNINEQPQSWKGMLGHDHLASQ